MIQIYNKMTYLFVERRKHIGCICKLSTSLGDCEPVQFGVHVAGALDAVSQGVCACIFVVSVQGAEVVSLTSEVQCIFIVLGGGSSEC